MKKEQQLDRISAMHYLPKTVQQVFSKIEELVAIPRNVGAFQYRKANVSTNLAAIQAGWACSYPHGEVTFNISFLLSKNATKDPSGLLDLSMLGKEGTLMCGTGIQTLLGQVLLSRHIFPTYTEEQLPQIIESITKAVDDYFLLASLVIGMNEHELSHLLSPEDAARIIANADGGIAH